jgi:hypothetical protein
MSGRRMGTAMSSRRIMKPNRFMRAEAPTDETVAREGVVARFGAGDVHSIYELPPSKNSAPRSAESARGDAHAGVRSKRNSALKTATRAR